LPVDDTWTSRDLPVLEAAVRGVDSHSIVGVALSTIANETTLPVEDVAIAARALQDAGYVAVTWRMRHPSSAITAVSGEARRIAGSWPSNDVAADRLLEAVRQLEASALSDDERGRLRKLLDALSGVSRDVVVQVASAAITGQMPH
jgi:hypothetical protein